MIPTRDKHDCRKDAGWHVPGKPQCWGSIEEDVKRKGVTMILCKIGLHRWERTIGQLGQYHAVRLCKRCKRIQWRIEGRWVTQVSQPKPTKHQMKMWKMLADMAPVKPYGGRY